MSSILGFIPRERSRLLTHALMAFLSLGAWGIAARLTPDYPWFHSLTDATAYISLALIVFTLIWGPVKLLIQKRNPVNLMLRRDVGLWAGITGVIHVVTGLQVHMSGNILMYFFQHNAKNPYKPLTDLFGLSNDIGLLATVVLVALLLISNDLSLRILRGGLWKWLQRSNYILIALVVVHAIGYQLLVKRIPFFTGVVVTLTLAALIAQLTGVLISFKRARSAKPKPAA